MTGGRSGGRSGGWAGGDYAAAGDAWAHAADDVVHGALARYGRPGSPAPRVLDVGTGSGPAALAAAGAGARVVGLDREEGLLRVAADRANGAEAGGSVRLVAADALALPFAAGVFDVVLSTFGVMFVPGPARAAAEPVRVCRPGGLVVVASWTPDGVLGRIAPTVTRHLGSPPPASPPTRWGETAHVRDWFGPLPVTVATRRERIEVRYPSLAHAVEVFENKPGPLRAHRSALEAAGRRGRARASPAALFEEHNRATDGSVRLDVPYLLVHAEVRAEPEPHRSSGTNKVRRGN
ncbi:class I SAM-dependent methyltransferase [Streptomyces sp. ZSW22]|uniref:class I SAM-dependent methyltransferase n=1 Tax=Streptomyces sp. ZSW22 TaxID=3055050 RepID=UPI0025B036C7|nr:class I SAM-dependent methyltransferase [Streptomyces sp. ZSW22]MDN3244743.1 methyltransferase domain-containing protein [Streptomyces sp. ZSW22]